MNMFSNVAVSKSVPIRTLIRQALEILSAAGVQTHDLTARRLEKMAMAFLAVADMKSGGAWANCATPDSKHILRTRDIIEYHNRHFEEHISSGSYDDIRRKDLKRPVLLSLIVKSAGKAGADTNDGTRGYAISEKLSDLAKVFGSDQWERSVAVFEIDTELVAKLTGERELKKLPVKLPDGMEVFLDTGPHNSIQKAIVEEFLPRFGHGAELYYIGDTSDKMALKNDAAMKKIGLNVADRGMLPDIVAYSQEKEWVFLIEAVHSSNPLNPERCIELSQTVLASCPFGVVFVTAFLSRADFRKWVGDIAWETEVWLADQPDHMIHFNGDRFFGPHIDPPSSN